MHYAANAYTKVAQATQAPRELEATILMKAATRLQAVRDSWSDDYDELRNALTYNRKLWTVLVTSATEPDNPLPNAVKQNVANLGIFVFGHTLRLMVDPAPERLGVLININRDVAAGLRATPSAP